MSARSLLIVFTVCVIGQVLLQTTNVYATNDKKDLASKASSSLTGSSDVETGKQTAETSTQTKVDKPVKDAKTVKVDKAEKLEALKKAKSVPEKASAVSSEVKGNAPLAPRDLTAAAGHEKKYMLVKKKPKHKKIKMEVYKPKMKYKKVKVMVPVKKMKKKKVKGYMVKKKEHEHY